MKNIQVKGKCKVRDAGRKKGKGGAMDWMSVSPRNSCVETCPRCDGIGGGLCEEIRSWGWSPHGGDYKREPRELSPSEVWGHNEKMAVYPPGSGSWPDTKSASPLIPDFPDLRTVKSKRLSFEPPSLWHFCYSSRNRLKQKRVNLKEHWPYKEVI